jgi:hypothetical protein
MYDDQKAEALWENPTFVADDDDILSHLVD